MSSRQNYIPSSDLKTILHSKRANLYYLEHCRILVNGGRVEYLTDQGKESLYWNIPIANTTSLLLGTGTSITQAAVRELGKAGVMIGFCGGDGTPLFAASEIEWLSPQSEYRPTQYLQQWCSFWFEDEKRLTAAKLLQHERLQNLRHCWAKQDWTADLAALDSAIDHYERVFAEAADVTALLTAEGRLTAKLYQLANAATLKADFTRNQGGNSTDPANRFLDQGNYLAYGLGATACWVLGLPHGLAILHGKTRRGGLVFDAADLIKDALILPQAFRSAMAGDGARDFRQQCIEQLTHFEALDRIIASLQRIAGKVGRESVEKR